MTASVQPPPLRADAQRNLDRILDAASRVFAERGQGATLSDVARRAGVGVGTVYRRFPDKGALLEALLEDRIDALVRLAEQADSGSSAQADDPGAAFRDFLLRLMEARATDRVLDLILLGAERGERFARELERRFLPLVGSVMRRAEAAGELREGMAPSEVCVLAHMIGTVADRTRTADADLWRRYAHLLVDGTRPAAAREALSPAPLHYTEIAAALAENP